MEGAKILKNTLFVLDKLDNGGLQKVNSEIANLVSSEREVSIFTLQNEEPYYELSETINLITPSSIDHFYEKKLFFIKSINYLFKALTNRGLKIVIDFEYEYLKRVLMTKQFDSVVLSGPALLFAKKIKKDFPKINTILWMHSNVDKYLNSYFKYEKKLLIQNLNVADYVLVLNSEDRSGYAKYSNNVKLMPNPSTILANGISNLTKKKILIVARIDILTKGLDYLIPLADKIPDDWQIDLVGAGHKKQENKLRQLIDENGLSEKIIMHGPKKTTELKEFYLNSSIYLSTSRWEGFGLVLLEAMSFGLPIIAFEQSGSKDILNDGEFGVLVKQGDVLELSRQLNYLINDIEVRRGFQKKSLGRVNQYTPDKILKMWLNLI